MIIIITKKLPPLHDAGAAVLFCGIDTGEVYFFALSTFYFVVLGYL